MSTIKNLENILDEAGSLPKFPKDFFFPNHSAIINKMLAGKSDDYIEGFNKALSYVYRHKLNFHDIEKLI